MTRLIASVENSAGKSATAKTNTNGTFTVTVEKGSPYLIKVKSGDKVVFSYATDATSTASVNVTQLTTQALFDGSGNLDLEKVFTSWASNKPLNEAKVLAYAKKVVANLKATLIAKRFT